MTYTIQQAPDGTPLVLEGFTHHSQVQHLARQELGEDLKYADVFFYLHRRFGPTTCSADPTTEQANYLLTTPHPDVFLLVRVVPVKRSHFMFHAVITQRLRQTLPGEPFAEDHPLLQEIQQALRVALKALKAPVGFQQVQHHLNGPLPGHMVRRKTQVHPPHPAIAHGILHRWLTDGPTLEELER